MVHCEGKCACPLLQAVFAQYQTLYSGNKAADGLSLPEWERWVGLHEDILLAKTNLTPGELRARL